MDSIIASMSAREEPDNFGIGSDHDAFFVGAELLKPGAQVLAEASDEAAGPALMMLAGHILECLLKAFPSKKRNASACTLRKEFGHNLEALWTTSASDGLDIESVLPTWVEQLHRLHWSPYRLRYPDSGNMLSLPETQSMMSGLDDLFEKVRATHAVTADE